MKIATQKKSDGKSVYKKNEKLFEIKWRKVVKNLQQDGMF